LEPEQLDEDDVKEDVDCDFLECDFDEETRDDISILGPADSITRGFS
jgi:hypothetical protein